MKIKFKVIGISVGFGLLFWLIDTILAYSIFYEGTFIGLLITEVPKTAVYTRFTVLGFFIIFGILMSDAIRLLRDNIKRRKEIEEELREGEEKFRKISASAKDAIIISDNDGKISYWNDAAEIIFQYRRNEVLGKDLQIVFPERFYEIYEKGFSRFKTTGQGSIVGETGEFSGRRKDGTEFPLEISISSVKIKDKWNAIGIVRDITERKKVEEELRIKNLAVDSSINAIALADPKGKLTYVNPSFIKMWGYDEKDIFGKRFVELWQNEEKALEITDTLHDKGSCIGEWPAKKKDGSIFMAELSANIVTDKAGKPICMIASFVDTTDQKHAEEELQLRSEFERIVTSISTNFINILSGKTDNVINETVQSIGEFCEGDHCYVFLFSDDRTSMVLTHEWCSESVAPQINNHIKLPAASFPWQMEMIKKSETIFVPVVSELPSEASFFKEYALSRRVKSVIQAPIAYGGSVIGFLGLNSVKEEKTWSVDIVVMIRIVGDIIANALEHKRVIEQLNASLKEKEVLLKEIHHRVKNNMQVISSLLNLQSSRFKDEKILKMFEESQERIRSMALIHEKLYQSKDLAKVNFSEYIKSLTDRLFQSYRIDPNKVTLEMNIEDVSLDINSGIPCGLIINELVSNSLKYAFPDSKEWEDGGKPKGKIHISLRSEDKGKFSLCVSDNGVGLPEDFDLQNTNSFGLQLVMTLTEQLHGTIDIQKKEGTTYKITFG